MLQSKQVAARKPLPEPITAVNPVEVYGEYVVPAGGIPLNSIIEMVGIPAYTIPTGWKLVCDDLDSAGSPAITLTVGKLSGLFGANDDARTFTADWLATPSNVGQAGGIVSNSLAAPMLYVPSPSDVGIAIKVNAAAATPIVGARLRLFVTCIPADLMLT